MTPNERIEQLQRDRSAIDDQIVFWEMVQEAADQESSPRRDRIVIKEGDEYLATYCWEINPSNGWVTVGLREDDGSQSVMPTRPGNWCLYGYASDHWGIERSEIKLTDKESDYRRDDAA